MSATLRKKMGGGGAWGHIYTVLVFRYMACVTNRIWQEIQVRGIRKHGETEEMRGEKTEHEW